MKYHSTPEKCRQQPQHAVGLLVRLADEANWLGHGVVYERYDVTRCVADTKVAHLGNVWPVKFHQLDLIGKWSPSYRSTTGWISNNDDLE